MILAWVAACIAVSAVAARTRIVKDAFAARKGVRKETIAKGVGGKSIVIGHAFHFVDAVVVGCHSIGLGISAIDVIVDHD